MWKDLTLQQKAEIMKMSVANGVTDINTIRDLYDGSVGHKFDKAGRIITLADLPREYVRRYGHINVVTPKGVRMPLSQAYRDYNQTPINVNDVPGLTDYLIKQDQPDIAEQAHVNKVAADRKVHQLGEERDKALMGLAAAVTGGGALASGLALAPVATIGSTIGGIAGEKAFNAGYEKLTGNNWGQDVERWTNGYIPAEYGEYLNPGALIGGIAEEPLRKFVGRNAYKGFLALPQTKRAVEVAMRTTGNANPLEEMSAHINYLTHTPEGRQQAKDILHYIATGKRQTDRPYRSLNSQGDVYTGLIGDYPEEFEYEPLIQIPEALSKDIGNDYIDAYLYGKQISPKLFNYKGISDKADNVFKEYVNTVYPNKKVQVYEAPIPHNARVVEQNKLTNVQNLGISKPMHTNDPRVLADTSGHLMYTANIDGANPELRALKEADIWKFNPADYKKRYKENLSSTNTKQKITQKLIDTGLKIVDDIGNPVIVETPWYTLKNGGHLFNKGGSKNKKKSTQGTNYHTNEAQAFVDELVAAGVRPVDAYAAAGNVFVESRFNHEASNNINGGHWGLVQNDANIKRHIIKYYGDYSRNSQMQFLKDGLTGQIKGAKNARWLQQRFDDYRRHSAGVKDASVAAKYFHDDYERSRNELVADRMRAASFYQTGVASNPSIATYNKIYGTPRLDISNDILYNSAQELQWTPITQESPKINPLSISTNNIEIPIPKVEVPTVTPIEERFPLEARLPNIASLLSYLPDQQSVVQPKISAPQYVSTPIDVWNEPYLLFGRT